MTTLGIAVIGQAPRDDIAAIFATALPQGTRIVLRGCLDGLSDAEVDALPPRDGDDTLYTRLRGERDVKISKAAVIERAPAVLEALRRDRADALLFACTGAFPPMPGDA
ncbi:MAG: AroM family protein, partial [Microvirga sp.]